MQLAYDHLSKYSGLELLEATAKMTVIAQTRLCKMAADLQSGDLEWGDYSDATSKRSIQRMTNAAAIPDISVVMKAGGEDNEEKVHLGVPYIDSELKETIFVGVLLGSLFCFTCGFFVWCNRRLARS